MPNVENVIGFEPLYESMNKCRRAVGYKQTVTRFCDNGIREVTRLEEELHTGAYRPRKPQLVIITHPKRREAQSIAFRDRVFQRSLNDNVIYPVMTKSFCYENMACQKGKGPDLARNYLAEKMRHHYRKYGLDGWILQIDVRGYYPNMSHKAVEDMFRRKLPPDIYALVEPVLRAQQVTPEKGYYAGSQMIQIAGISLLNPLDHEIKERMRPEVYLRYMDDMILIDRDREKLERCRAEIGKWLTGIGFEMHPRKTHITPFADGVTALGFTHRCNDYGKVVRIIKPGNVKAERKKLFRLVQLAKTGKLTRKKTDECFHSWLAHASRGDSHLLARRMTQYYKSLWR